MTENQPLNRQTAVPPHAIGPSGPVYSLPIIAQCMRRMEFAVGRLIDEAKAEATWTESYVEAAELLESIPFATGEFELAHHRLQNALDYCGRGEFGAACFELRQLRNQLAAL
jgi:hypothetical protein